MEKNNTKKEGFERTNPEGTATHSGWQYFYEAYARYRDECIRVGRVVLGNNLQAAVANISDYHSAIYTLAQQVFSFYGDEKETELTKEWIEIGEEVNNYLSLYSDFQFRQQMVDSSIPKELKIKLLKFFNKIDRMATEAGLQVLKEDKTIKEPKRGMLGF